MDLKKLFGLSKVKQFMLTHFLPEEMYLKMMYKRAMGKELDLKSPKSLNEKIQWLKLYDRCIEHTIYADKYRVREFIKKELGDEYLIPLLRCYDAVKEMENDNLPEPPYIIKNNHDSSGGIIVRAKLDVNLPEFKKTLSANIRVNHFWATKEWQYKNIPKKIVIEKLLLDKHGNIPNDYKFNCFNGRVEFIYASIDREGGNYRKIYMRDWSPSEMTWTSRGNELKKFSGPEIPKPENFDQMIYIAEKLASNFKYIRIDLYNVDGKIYFGEITQHHGSGFEPILPESLDYYYGSLITLK